MELPTREDLRHVRCLASGEVWIAGATGTLLVGRQDRFRVVQPIEGGPDFHAVAAFVGGVYVAAGRAGVWSVSGNKVGPLKPNVVSTHLEVCGDLLRSVGDDLAVRCDGAAWFGGQFRFDG
ncbi:hypothetical protein L6R50_25525 [Myxococcota bacterium]|nr:hypothetical protein [Myxococcota bacterium]